MSGIGPVPALGIEIEPGADASFAIYDDDGVTNAYKAGRNGTTATLRWDDATGRLRTVGKLPTGQDATALVQVIGAR